MDDEMMMDETMETETETDFVDGLVNWARGMDPMQVVQELNAIGCDGPMCGAYLLKLAEAA